MSGFVNEYIGQSYNSTYRPYFGSGGPTYYSPRPYGSYSGYRMHSVAAAPMRTEQKASIAGVLELAGDIAKRGTLCEQEPFEYGVGRLFMQLALDGCPMWAVVFGLMRDWRRLGELKAEQQELSQTRPDPKMRGYHQAPAYWACRNPRQLKAEEDSTINAARIRITGLTLWIFLCFLHVAHRAGQRKRPLAEVISGLAKWVGIATSIISLGYNTWSQGAHPSRPQRMMGYYNSGY